MADVNFNTDVKAYSMPVAPAAVETEDRTRPQVRPVAEDTGSNGASMDNNVLQRKAEEKQQQQVKPVPVEELSKAVEDVQKRLDSIGGNLAISLSQDQASREIVVKVVNRKNGEVVRQLPPEETLKLREKLKDVVGLLFDKKI